MSEILNNEEDLNEIISSMESIDEEVEPEVTLFQDIKIEQPFQQTATVTSSQPEFTFGSDTDEDVDEECTIIGCSTIINSSITCGGSIDVKGHIIGKLTVAGRSDIYGIVEGDIEAGAVAIHSGAKIKGNILSKAECRIDEGGDVVGNIAAKSAYIESSVQGNVEAVTELNLAATASVFGDITTANISVANGAVINGRIAIKR